MCHENSARVRVAVVIVQDGKMLLVEHGHGGQHFWIPPGGGLEFQETLAECGAREMLEETGLEVRIGEFLFVAESIPSVVYPHEVILHCRGEVLGGELSLGDDECLADIRWFDRSELQDLRIYPNIREHLVAVMDGRTTERSLGCHSAVDAGLTTDSSRP